MNKLKIDLHVHTSEYSNCSIATPEEQIEAAISKGIDGLVFTEHHSIFDINRLNDLREKYSPFMIFSGIEITLSDETSHTNDILVLGIRDNRLENKNWNYKDLYRFVRKKDGFMILAHPFRWDDFIIKDIYNYPPDAVEIRSSNLTEDGVIKREELCSKLKAIPVENSDGHSIDKVGIYYNVLNVNIENDRDLINALKDKDTGGYNGGN